MRERPIIFNSEMISAIIRGKKTQTRRLKGLASKNEHPNSWHREGDPRRHTYDQEKGHMELHMGLYDKIYQAPEDIAYMRSPYGHQGDLLYVRESMLYCFDDSMLEGEDSRLIYKASVHEDWYKALREKDPAYRWTPSIHMKKEDARIWLQIKGIRLERLQSISEADAKAEGVATNGRGYKTYIDIGLDEYELESAYWSFNSLWCKINGGDSWELNPWVWVVDFEVLSTTGKPSQIITKSNL
jgi:hypothetical protein